MVHGLVYKSAKTDQSLSVRSESPLPSAIFMTSMIGSSILSIPQAAAQTPSSTPSVVGVESMSTGGEMTAGSETGQSSYLSDKLSAKVANGDIDRCSPVTSGFGSDDETGKTMKQFRHGETAETSFTVESEVVTVNKLANVGSEKRALNAGRDVIL